MRCGDTNERAGRRVGSGTTVLAIHVELPSEAPHALSQAVHCLSGRFGGSHEAKALRLQDRFPKFVLHLFPRRVVRQQQVVEARVRSRQPATPSHSGCAPQRQKRVIQRSTSTTTTAGTYCSESGPAREMTNFRDPSPLMGDRSLPVQNDRNRFFSSCEQARTRTDTKQAHTRT